MDGVEVRRASAGEVGLLAALQWRWRVEEWSGAPAVDREAFSAALREWARDRRDSHPAFVAAQAGRVLGMAWLAVVERVPTPVQLTRRNGLVQSVYVVPEARGREVGAALLERVVDEARRLGLDHLLVHPSERSFPFYRRHGFRGHGEFLVLDLRRPRGRRRR